MSFKAILSELVCMVPGAGGAILADWEGEAVDHVAMMDEYELKVMVAHFGIILNRIRELQQRLDDGPVMELLITMGNRRVIVGAVGNDYCLLIPLDRDAVIGRAAVGFRRVRETLVKEIY